MSNLNNQDKRELKIQNCPRHKGIMTNYSHECTCDCDKSQPLSVNSEVEVTPNEEQIIVCKDCYWRYPIGEKHKYVWGSPAPYYKCPICGKEVNDFDGHFCSTKLNSEVEEWEKEFDEICIRNGYKTTLEILVAAKSFIRQLLSQSKQQAAKGAREKLISELITFKVNETEPWGTITRLRKLLSNPKEKD